MIILCQNWSKIRNAECSKLVFIIHNIKMNNARIKISLREIFKNRKHAAKS